VQPAKYAKAAKPILSGHGSATVHVIFHQFMGGVTHGYPRDQKKNRHFEVVQHHDDDDDFDENWDVCIGMY